MFWNSKCRRCQIHRALWLLSSIAIGWLYHLAVPSWLVTLAVAPYLVLCSGFMFFWWWIALFPMAKATCTCTTPKATLIND
jgi:hypothetical protein